MIDLKSLRDKALREGMKIMSNDKIMKIMSNKNIMNLTTSAMKLRERVQTTVETRGGELVKQVTTRLKDIETRISSLRGKADGSSHPHAS